MTAHGDGAFWGDASTWGIGYQVSATRLLYMTREGSNFQSLTHIMDTRAGDIYGILGQMLELTDIDTAVGEGLDRLGALLFFPRESMSDTRYRRAIKAYRIVLQTRGTSPDMLRVWEAWIGDPPTTYSNAGPATIKMSGIVPLADEEMLGLFLRKMASAGVTLGLSVATTKFLICDDVDAPLPDPGTCDDVVVPVADAYVLTVEI